MPPLNKEPFFGGEGSGCGRSGLMWPDTRAQRRSARFRPSCGVLRYGQVRVGQVRSRGGSHEGTRLFSACLMPAAPALRFAPGQERSWIASSRGRAGRAILYRLVAVGCFEIAAPIPRDPAVTHADFDKGSPTPRVADKLSEYCYLATHRGGIFLRRSRRCRRWPGRLFDVVHRRGGGSRNGLCGLSFCLRAGLRRTSPASLVAVSIPASG